MKTRNHPDSNFKTIQEFNKIVYRVFKPQKDKHGTWTYGKLYFYSDDAFGRNRPAWVLDGMTPVGWPYVLGTLKLNKKNDAYYEKYFRNHIR